MKTAKTKPSKSVSRFTLHESASASALILAVVLTSLLAIIGVMFIMMARVDRMATSAVSENKELDFAVETVAAKISQELVLDVPGMPKGKKDYYDYPDANNTWLASLEPYEKTAGNYYWRQISNITGMGGAWGDLQAEIIVDYQQNIAEGVKADADGDGAADSKWVELDDVTSNKGKPIYAAIRIVDNGGMLNVNTAYKFDPNSSVENEIDGSSQTQINLLALSERGSTSNPLGKLDDARFGSEPPNLNDYIRDVVWRYNEPNGRYTPFDISDELELRNRFTLNRSDVDSRIEEVWDSAFQGPGYLRVPVDSSGSFSDWREEVYYDWSEPNANNNYSYRHIATTYNMDRIIDPNGKKMVNINDANVISLYSAIRAGLYDADPNFAGANGVAAQIAVNLVDFRDNDSNVSTIDVNSVRYYGFERPCIYISELAHRFLITGGGGGPIGSDVWRSYAVELYKPYSEDAHPEPNQWRLVIDGANYDIVWPGTQQFYVRKWENTNTTLDVDPGASSQSTPINYTEIFRAGSIISLQRCIDITNNIWITVDSYVVSVTGSTGWLMAEDGTPFSIQRDINPHKCIRRLWASPSEAGGPELGQDNTYSGGGPDVIQAHPANEDFTNIGEIGMLFRKPTYYEAGQPIPSGVIGYSIDSDTEEEVRIDLADPNFQQLFKYLTVFDPYNFHPADANYANETRIKGRININTAPWFVLAQLPWVSQRIGGTDYSLAQAIVEYRDELKTPKGFESIGELMNVAGMDYYVDGADLDGFPDLTTPDHPLGGAADDFEERDVIFARISNLVTVRSDVFTAYILVRIGADGPQKRIMAILDRSDVYSGDGKVRIVALHPVPDPR